MTSGVWINHKMTIVQTVIDRRGRGRTKSSGSVVLRGQRLKEYVKEQSVRVFRVQLRPNETAETQKDLSYLGHEV